MSKPSTVDKINFITRVYLDNISFKDAVIKELIPTLKIREKKTKLTNHQNETIEEERTSVFIQKENEMLNQMLSGEYTFNKIE